MPAEPETVSVSRGQEALCGPGNERGASSFHLCVGHRGRVVVEGGEGTSGVPQDPLVATDLRRMRVMMTSSFRHL
ncbi:MAG TPA: hypothetical protein VJB57_00195 [Dehalococcoidia bacterium]|nr:hypothetical protein [Dehalococcoidia bacterium]